MAEKLSQSLIGLMESDHSHLKEKCGIVLHRTTVLISDEGALLIIPSGQHFRRGSNPLNAFSGKLLWESGLCVLAKVYTERGAQTQTTGINAPGKIAIRQNRCCCCLRAHGDI
jgi:hypothetical protein